MENPPVVVRGLRKVYWFNVALDNVDLVIEESGVHILVGPNGSGKSTLLSILAGAERPSSGYVRVLGFNPWRDSAKLAGRVRALLDRISLPPWLPCIDIIRVAADLYKVDWSNILDIAEMLGVKGFWSRPYGTYSSGMRRKCLILLAFTGEAELLMLDEPFQGLDSNSVNTTINLIESRAKQGSTVILATHIIPEKLMNISKTIIRMELGKIIEITKQQSNITPVETRRENWGK